MSDTFFAVLLVLGPTYASCAVAIAWSEYSASDRLAHILRLSGMVWAVLLTQCFGIMAYLSLSCDGSALYGFTQCTVVSDRVADVVFGIGFAIYGIAILYGLLLLIVGGIWEAILRYKET